MTPQKVLLMDDDEMVRTLMARRLERLGCAVDVADEGGAAVAAYRRRLENGRPYDAVILDLRVRDGLDGAATIRELRALDPGVQAVVTTGQTDDPVLNDFWDHGFAAVLTKPCQLQDIEEVLAKVLPGGTH